MLWALVTRLSDVLALIGLGTVIWAVVQISKGHPGPDHAGIGFHLAEGDRLMVYRAEADGSLWIRTPEEFNDGRFEDVAISVGSAHV